MVRDLVFAVTVFSTVFCAAVNAYTYQVAYPLWRHVGGALPGVHREYLRRLWPVITVPHVVMFFASGALVFLHPASMPAWCAVVVFSLNAGVVVVSAFAAGPIHDRITKLGVMDERDYRGLMRISAARVVMFALSCAILFAAMLR
jgi:hypothetical protein